MPIPIAPISSARNGCIFSQVINTMITAMPTTADRISCASLPLGTIGSCATARRGLVIDALR